MNRALAWLSLAITIFGSTLLAQTKHNWLAQEQAIVDQIRHLRGVPDAERGAVTKQIALDIRKLPVTPNKLSLAVGLAERSTEGDFGHDTLQEVATTLADALNEQPQPDQKGQPAYPYFELADLVRYEHVSATLESPHYSAAMAELQAEDQRRENADFTLSDLDGKQWSLKSLKGKVVLVNFWATWCPPCKKEMPDLESLYRHFKDQGLVVLGISDEDASKLKPFIAVRSITYPILLDPGRKVNDEFSVMGIPRSFVYDRDGKLVSEAIDMRTQQQFLALLAQAGLK